MPLIKLQTIADDTQLGVWKIDEGLDFFMAYIESRGVEGYSSTGKVSDKRKLEYAASRYLLLQLCDEPIEIVKDSYGKPYLNNKPYHISISHTKNFAAAIFSKHFAVGVDIEHIHQRVHKVQHKFLNGHEKQWLGEAPSTNMVTLCWSAKESLYKLYGKKQLDFIEHLKLIRENENALRGIISKDTFEREYRVNNEQIENAQLTYVVDDGG